MERGRLHFTIGLPRSGKSTFCDTWVRHPEIRFALKKTYDLCSLDKLHQVDADIIVTKPRVVITGDSFRRALHGKEYGALSEATVFANIDIATRAMLESGYDVMVDETATTPETIKRYLRIDIDAEPHWIDTPVQTCIHRAVKDKRVYLVEPIKRMAAQLERLKCAWPQSFEGLKDEVRSRWSQDRMNNH